MSTNLFEPITLRGVTFKNRLWIPPMCMYSVTNHDGIATDWHLMHYGALAQGGAGGIIVEATAVVPEGRISPRDLGLWNDNQIAGLKRITDLAHGEGAKMGIQLAHAGRKGSTYSELDGKRGQTVEPTDGGWQTVAPSAIPYSGIATPQALDANGIQTVIEAFGAAARRALEAGFDFIEIHGAHGYLIHEFLSPLSNERTDEYGGTLENRVRLLQAVVRHVREVIPEQMPLVVRLSATDWVDGGLTGDDTVQIVNSIKDLGVDLIDVSTGGNVPAQIPVGPGYQTRFAEQIRRETGVPTAAVGMIDEAWQAEHVISTGQADVVLSGRQTLRDPYFPLHAAIELGVENIPCPPQALRAFNQRQRLK